MPTNEPTEPTDNLALWHSVEKTDPAATKKFTRAGGFTGTAISPMWLIRRATEVWGPMGTAWGIRISSQEVIEGAPITAPDGQIIGCEKIHILTADLFYPEGVLPCIGQTMLVGKNKYGAFTDEEAPKKSLTDALSKGLSWLGFGADVHMGRFDDSKYVNQVSEELHAQRLREQTIVTLYKAAKAGEKPTRTVILALSKEARALVEDELPKVLEKAKQTDDDSANTVLEWRDWLEQDLTTEQLNARLPELPTLQESVRKTVWKLIKGRSEKCGLVWDEAFNKWVHKGAEGEDAA